MRMSSNHLLYRLEGIRDTLIPSSSCSLPTYLYPLSYSSSASPLALSLHHYILSSIREVALLSLSPYMVISALTSIKYFCFTLKYRLDMPPYTCPYMCPCVCPYMSVLMCVLICPSGMHAHGQENAGTAQLQMKA